MSVFMPALAKAGANTLMSLAGDSLANKLIGSREAEKASARSLHHATVMHNLGLDAYKKRYQWTMEDMRRAGLNPILAAASGGFNVSGVPTMGSPGAFQAHSPYGTTAAGALDIEKAKTEEKTQMEKMENVRKLRNQAQALIGQFKKDIAQAKLSEAQKENVRKEWFNIEQRFNEMTSKIAQLDAQTELYRRQADETQQKIKHIDKLLAEKDFQIFKLKMLNKRIQHINKVWDGDNETLQRINEVLKALTGRL